MNYSVFLINLDRSVERLANATGQLNSAGVDFERISAVDGKNLEKELIHKVFDDKMAKKRYHYDLTLGEIGCYLSHVKCWKKIIDDGLDFAVILEDDLLLEPNFKDVIESVSNIEAEWHYLKLSCPFKRRPYTEAQSIKTTKNNSVSLVDYKKPPTGTVAQVVSHEGAMRLLKNRPPFFRPVDVDLQWSWELNIKVQGLIPYVANVSGEPSEIQKISARKTVKKRPFNKIKETVRFKLKG